MSEGNIVLAAVGDVVLLRPPSEALLRAPWDEADLRVANLEAPLTPGGIPAAKLIRLKSPVAAADWLADLGCHCVSLANNHIMDWGEPGLASTLSALDAVGIRYAGAGRDADEAEQHVILSVGGWRVAFLSWASTIPAGFQARDGRPGLAGIRVRTSYAADGATLDEQPGTPPWVHTEAVSEDVARLVAALQRARAEADFVVLALHWGVPPQWQSRFQGPLADYQAPLGRQLVAAGADLILGCHAHTVYGIEAVPRVAEPAGLICYSLGNYVFHPLADREAVKLDSPLLPYRAEEMAENSETYIARFSLSPTTAGQLAIAEARLVPALLDEAWEARAPTPERARLIVNRVAAFSLQRHTPVEREENAVVWRSGDGS